MHFRLRGAMVCALAALPWLVQAAAAQAPAERATLAHLLDSTIPSLSAPSSSTSLPYSTMLRGIELLRSARAGGGRDELDAAQAAFDEAIYRAPEDWPWPWYGLALVDLALDSAGYAVKPSMHQPAGLYYRDAAIRALGKALDADSSFAPAAKLLAARLTSIADPAVNHDVVRTIRRAAAAGKAGPQPWLVFARMQRSLNHPDSALRAFRHYLAAGGDTAVAFIEESRSLLASGDSTDAAPMYLRGADHAGTADGKKEYRRDLAWIASPMELTMYDSLPSDGVGAWIRAFWAKRDAGELRAPGERLTEHIRRWVYVHDHFMAPQLSTKVSKALRMPLTERLPDWAPPSLTETPALGGSPASPTFEDQTPMNEAELMQASYLGVATGSADFLDDRALMYMRHGEPDQVVRSTAKRGVAPLAWSYDTPTEGRIVLYFKCTLYCLLVPFPISRDGLMALDVRYEFPSPPRSLVDDVKHDLRAGLTTDGFPPHFRHQLEPAAQFFAVGAPGRVLVVFALPGDKLEHITLPDGGAGYPVVLRVIATNAAGQIARMDTTRRFRADQPLAKGQYLFGLEELKLAPGTWDVRLLVTEAGLEAGGAIGRIGMTVPSAAHLALSDLVLGRDGAGLVWQSPAGPVPLNPLDAFPPKGSAELYYELHGATPDSTYQTDIEVKGVYGDARGTVHLTFSERAHGAVVRTRRSIGLDQLETGQYLVTVTVTEQGTGKTAVQQRYLNVRE
jgi:hypothetical protein